MSMKIARFLLIASTTVCIIVIAYSVALTAAAGQVLAYALAALGAGILALLVLVGLIDADRAEDGLFTSVLALLPRALKHGMADWRRALVYSILLLSGAALSYWVGPAGLNNVAVACGEAAKIRPFAAPKPVDCKASHVESYWRSPLQRTEIPLPVCYDKKLVSWTGEWTEKGLGTCGQRPLEARFARAEIDVPEIAEPGFTANRDREEFERLTNALRTEIPDLRTADDTLLFATWNIRFLGRAKRIDVAHAHIAQIISFFDIVAFQELQSANGLAEILEHLGPNWRAEYGLESPGSMGNRERLGFLYDSRKVKVDPVSSNMVLASSDLRHTATGQPARPPFVAAFSVNERKILVANTHIVFGRPDARADRIEELKAIALNLSEHADNSFGGIPALLVGDVNSERPDGPVIEAIEGAGLFTDPALKAAPSSVFTDKVYDQIYVRNDPAKRLAFGRVGSFNPFDHIMRSDDFSLYKTEAARDMNWGSDETRNKRLYHRWRSFQISDHRVKWAEFRMDW